MPNPMTFRQVIISVYNSVKNALRVELVDPVVISGTTIVEGVLYAKEIDISADGNTIYLGYSLPNGDPTLAVWRIKRLIKIGNDWSAKWADGDTLFNNIWNNRAALSYP